MEQRFITILEYTRYEFYGAAIPIDDPFMVESTRYSHAFEFFCADRDSAKELVRHLDPLHAIGEIKCNGLDCVIDVNIYKSSASPDNDKLARLIAPKKIIDGISPATGNAECGAIMNWFGKETNLICGYARDFISDIVIYLPDKSVTKGTIHRCDITSYKVVMSESDGSRINRYSQS